MLTFETLHTPDGPFTVVERGDGAVVAAGWTDDVTGLLSRSRLGGQSASLGSCASSAAVRAYYAGDPAPVTQVRLAVEGTAFQRAVWDALRAIPAGEVRAYGQVASSIGNPAAVRAVGAACGANPAALFVPCHRVTGAGGALTGFAWGVDVKRALLEREAGRAVMELTAAG